MKIVEVLGYPTKYVDPSIEKILNKYSRKKKKGSKLGHDSAFMSYPIRVK